jgi:HAD superfamily hydrolase (TIGR01484 family)
LAYPISYKIVFSDFDGTLTEAHEQLTPVFFNIQKHLLDRGKQFIIVSGRSLSWGHFLMTHTHIDAAIMEGGGVIIYRDKSGHLQQELLVTDAELNSLEKTTVEILNKYSHLKLSVDSQGRKTDRAIELYDFKSVDEKKTVEADMKLAGLHFSSSNVHLNFWAGDVSKFRAIKYYVEKYTKISLSECLFFGDAPNDQSVFEHLEHTVGVSNIDRFLAQIKFHPKTILQGEDKRGPKGVYHYLKTLG